MKCVEKTSKISGFREKNLQNRILVLGMVFAICITQPIWKVGMSLVVFVFQRREGNNAKGRTGNYDK